MNATAIAARESARNRADGTFGEQERSSAEVQLPELSRDEAAQLLAEVTKYANIHASRAGVSEADRDEVVQETILDVLGQQRRGARHTMDPKFLNRASRAVAQRYVSSGLTHVNPKSGTHHTAQTALRILKRDEEAEMQRLGRELTPGERDRLADHIRMEYFEPGRRPFIGYHSAQAAVSLDAPVRPGDSEATLGDFLAAPDEDYTGAPSAAAAALDALDDGDLTVRDVRASAWSLIAGDDSPAVAPNGVNAPGALTALIDSHGDVSRTIDAWEAGKLSASDSDLLFSPFAADSAEKRAQVVSVLRRHRNYADDLFGEAKNAATSQEALLAERRAQRAAARRRQRAALKAGAA